jgi:hypothetical protein
MLTWLDSFLSETWHCPLIPEGPADFGTVRQSAKITGVRRLVYKVAGAWCCRRDRPVKTTPPIPSLVDTTAVHPTKSRDPTIAITLLLQGHNCRWCQHSFHPATSYAGTAFVDSTICLPGKVGVVIMRRRCSRRGWWHEMPKTTMMKKQLNSLPAMVIQESPPFYELRWWLVTSTIFVHS